jgi:glutamate dehydrogenase (NAD(P)+)
MTTKEGFRMNDDFGPARVMQIRVLGLGLTAATVVDNTARGPAVDGVHMASNVSIEGASGWHAPWTWKNAVACLPRGGGKSGIAADPRMLKERKGQIIRAFADAICDTAIGTARFITRRSNEIAA